MTGVWSELTYAVGGTITGRGSPGRIQVRAEGMIVNALLAVNTRDNKQSVSISLARQSVVGRRDQSDAREVTGTIVAAGDCPAR